MNEDASEYESDEAPHPSVGRHAVFVCDPSAEAERVAQQLRAAGFVVIDVPMSMLAARVAVQTPSVVVVDADASGVREAILAMRLAGGDAELDVLLLGHAGPDGLPASPDLSPDATRFFARPVDALAIVRKVEALTGGPLSVGARADSRPPSPRSLGPPTTTMQPWPDTFGRRSPLPPAPSSSPPGAPASGRPAPSSSPLRDSAISARSVRSAISIRTSLSAELEALLADAEQRIGAQMMGEVSPPTPEEELEAVLPEALLAALDEPLDDEDDDDGPGEAPRSLAANDLMRGAEEPGPAETNSSRVLTPPPTRALGSQALGVAPTMAAPPMPSPEASVVVPHASTPVFTPQEGLPRSPELLGVPTTLLRDDAPRLLATRIASRASGCFTVESDGGLRRVVLRDGDVVTAASSADDETLVVFLTTRGDLRHEQTKDLLGKVPPFGRHAGAALIGHGLLRQDELWPILRAHAEWVVGRMLLIARGTARFETEAPGRLRQEPSVFGGSSGAEVFIEVARRVFAPEEALRRLGGAAAMVTEGPSTLLSECALDPHERATIEAARGLSLEQLGGAGAGADIASLLYALSLLGVVTVATPAAVDSEPHAAHRAEPAGDVDALDLTAVRERVRARRELVAEADYFTLLGLSRDATGYDVRRAYLELRRSFEPSHILTPELLDLDADVRTIVLVLDEAYEILRDAARRERYRRALGDS